MRTNRGATAFARRPRLRRNHSAAFFGAAPASLRALPAMLHIVLFAFLGADVAYLGASFAYRGGQLARPRHVGDRKPADFGAVNVELDAARHRFHVFLVQARGRAMIAGLRALIACIDAGLLLVGHGRSFQESKRERGRSKMDAVEAPILLQQLLCHALHSSREITPSLLRSSCENPEPALDWCCACCA